MAVTPYKVSIPDADIADLKARLSQRRRPKPFDVPGGGQTEPKYGPVDSHLEELLEYWEKDFDWRKAEAKLNEFPQFMTEIDGLNVHFIHQKGKYPNAIPLILVHGWPGSIWEFLGMLPHLKEHFDVVVPHLPGFGFSAGSPMPGDDALKACHMFNTLMVERLGYSHYLAQGGDWGSAVVKLLGIEHPDTCVAIHLNLSITLPGAKPTLANLLLLLTFGMTAVAPKMLHSERDLQTWSNLLRYLRFDSAYYLMHSTRPNTVGWVLDSSPVSLAAWIFEKIGTWVDTSKRGIFEVLSKDDILADISTYWFTRSAASSVRFYHETMGLTGPGGQGRSMKRCAEYASVPTGVAAFPGEILNMPRRMVELAHNVVQYKDDFPEGGHFAAWERPGELAAEVTKFATETLNFAELVRQSKQDPKYGRRGAPLARTLRLGTPALGIFLAMLVSVTGGGALAASLLRRAAAALLKSARRSRL
eukprot:TRINITY_DN29176_c0_g1_i1.p1 TRINITY_DN29176_c0_g1~~TRINITY_DN29176_c0_g1_i1.p1  ORF type:complete len:474 (+),score=81.61 TRINITY_DN29176_c0_g1_i1:55-1476(+)